VIVAAPVSGWGSLAIMFGGILAVAISESHSVVEA
jgi:hypothetical protein